MPTIIDSLIIELGLDPRGFTEGQRRATESLRGMEAASAASASRISTTTGRSLREFMAGFDTHLSKISTQLTQLGSQSRRSGAAVGAGAREGAFGLTAMAEAGLAAYAALKTVEGAFRSVAGLASGGAQLGRTAAIAGVPTQWLSAFSLWAEDAVGADPATTQASVRGLRQKLERLWNFGEYDESFTALSAAGVNVGSKGAPRGPEIWGEIAAALRGMGAPQAFAWGEKFGIDPKTIQALMLGQNAVNVGTAGKMPIATTDNQSQAYDRLRRAIVVVTQAYDHLMDRLVEANPQWARAAEGFGGWLTELQSTPDGLRKVEAALNAVSIAIGVTVVAAVGRLAKGIIAANLEILKTPLGRLLFLGFAAAEVLSGGPGSGRPDPTGIGEGWTKWLDPLYLIRRGLGIDKPAGTTPSLWQRWAPSWLGGGGAAITPLPSSSTATSGNWEVRHNNFAGIRVPGIVAGPNAGGFKSYATPEEGVADIARLLLIYQDKHGLNTLSGIISRWAPPSENDTAGLISRASAITGFGPNQSLNLHDPLVMNRVIEAMIRGEQGGKLPPSAAIALGRQQTNVIRDARAAQSGILARGGMAQHNTDIDTHVGSINVYAPSGDANAIIGAQREAVRRNSLLVNAANDGLS